MKWHGKIGYATTVETEPGIWEESIIEREHFGDMLSLTRNLQNSNGVNDNVILSNSFSIVADPYASANIDAMRYIVYRGTKWKIANVSVQYPRLTLITGGIYNGT